MALGDVFCSIDRDHSDQSAATRRRFVAGAGAAIGGMGLLGLVGEEEAVAKNDAKTILNIAATADVLATIVNTVGQRDSAPSSMM